MREKVKEGKELEIRPYNNSLEHILDLLSRLELILAIRIIRFQKISYMAIVDVFKFRFYLSNFFQMYHLKIFDNNFNGCEQFNIDHVACFILAISH